MCSRGHLRPQQRQRLFRETTQMRRVNLRVVNALWSTAAELGAQVVDDDHQNIPRSRVRGRWPHAGLVI